MLIEKICWQAAPPSGQENYQQIFSATFLYINGQQRILRHESKTSNMKDKKSKVTKMKLRGDRANDEENKETPL